MKNLVFNLRTAKAQAEGCAKVTKSSRMAKILTTLTLLLTLGVGQMWGYDPHFSINGDVIKTWITTNYWYNNQQTFLVRGQASSQASDEWGAYMWMNNGDLFGLNNGSNRYSPTTNKTEISGSKGSGTYAYNGDNAFKYVGASGLVRVNIAESNSREWNPHIWLDESLEQNILNGTKIMFYIGEPVSWGQDYYYLRTTSSTSNDEATKYGRVNKVVDNKRYAAVYASSAQYYVGHSGWAGHQMAAAAEAGAYYHQNNGITKTAGVLPSFNKSSNTIKQGTANSGLSATASNSVIGNAQNVYYYYTQDNSTYTKFDPTNVSALAAGDYSVYALAFDGYICVRSASAATLTIEPVYTVTINNDGHGTPSPSGEQTNVGKLSGISIDASPSDGYSFKQWEITSGSGSFTSAVTTASNTFKPTAASTITATFKPDWALYNGSTLLGVFSKVSSTQYTLSVDLSKANHHQLQFKKDGATGYIVGAEDPTSTFRNLSSSTGYFDWANIQNVVTGTYFITLKYESSTWKYKAEQKYTLTYDANGATSGTAPVDGSSPYLPNTAITTAGNSGSLAKSSFNFTGWNTRADGQGTHYNASTANAFNITANTTLYAEWTPNVPSSACLAGDFGSVTMNKSTSGSTTTFTYTFYDKAAGTYNFYLKDCSSSTALLKATNGVTMTQTGCTSIASTGASNYYFRVVTGAAGDITITATYNTSAKTINMDVTRVAIDAVTPSWWLIGDAALFTNWNTNNHNYPLNRSYRGMSDVFYRVVDFGGNTTAYFKPLKGNTRYGHNEGGGNKTVVTGTQYAITNTDADGTAFKANGQGVVWCVVDQTNKKFWEQTPTTYYTITLANGSSGDTGNGVAGTEGTVTLTTNNLGNLKTKQYASGERVNISVSAKTGYYVDDITIGATSVATDVLASSYSGYTTMPSGNATLTVTYKPLYSVTFGVGTGMSSYGSVSNNLSISSGTKVLTGTSITFTATPNLGYKFVGWYREATCTNQVSTDNPYTVNVTSATTLYAKFAVRNLYIHADFISNWATPAQMTQSTVNRAIYTYTINNMAILASAQDGDAWNTGYHFHFVNTVANPNDNKAYNYNGVQTPTYSGSSIDGVHKTHTDNPTIEFGLTRKSNVTITLTLQSIDDATKPTLNIAADPIYTITHGDPTHGSYTIKVGSASAVGTSTESVATTTITLAATPATGYHFDHWTVTKAGGGTVTVTSNQFTMPSDDVTVAATFLPTSYDVTLKANGGSGADKVVSATYDAAMPSILKGGGTLIAHSRTGYNFAGYYDDASTGTQYYTNVLGSARAWDKASATNLFAHWSAKTYTITLTQSGETGYGSSGTASVTATYDAALPTIASLPTAAQGYAFMGYYTGHNGTGTQYYGPTGNKLVATYTTAGGIELFAYFKKAEITNLTFDAAVVAPSTPVGVMPTVAPTPTGTNSICWKLLYNNGNLYDPQPTFSPANPGGVGNKVTFNAPPTSGMYLVAAVLRTGSSCDGGTKLDSVAYPFQVAGNHTVTVQYKCGDVTIKASTTTTGRPLNWSDEITPPEIFGYTFSKWKAGDGVTMTIDGGETTIGTGGETTGKATTHAVQIKANYDGKLIAIYTKKSIIYFKNTLGWDKVYVNIMNNQYWDVYNGSGNSNNYYARNQEMSLVDGTDDIYYLEYSGSTSVYMSFTSMSQTNATNFWATTANNLRVVYPTHPFDDQGEQTSYGFNAGTPMFVPTAEQTPVDKNVTSTGKASYYNKGYWRKYDPIQGETGYTLKVYNKTSADGRTELKSIKFVESDVPGQLFKAVANLEAAEGYGIKFERDNSMLYTNTTGHLHRTGDVVVTEKGDANYKAIWIRATAAGDYTFAITINGDGKLCIQAEFPVVKNDYRVIYTDNDTWTKAHTARSWTHSSRIINAVANAVDTISFFVSKGHSPEFKIQKVNAINETTGAITWTDVTSWTSCNDVAASGAYNFIFTQNGSKEISFTKKEAYTGNYYIRTNCAGSSKWDNYRDNSDHLMTYTEYSIDHGGYSHYYCHWIESADANRKNIKFCIANDYSPCISDTLTRETASGEWANIGSFIESNGDLKRNANVRFMWNQSTNKISRAYLDPAQGDDNFLVLESADSKIANQSGVVQSSVVFSDNENWIYEANVKAKANAQIKLVATWGDAPTIVQYFKGTDESTETLITGSGTDWYNIRLIYDYKTNRLIAAMLPSGNLSDPEPINADVMFIREHQGDISQVTFTDDGALTDIKIAYGVMRFSKWTLNNKDKSTHLPLDDPKSYYERALYFISFPFEVKLSEVFGFGTYAQDWIIEYYDGAARAATGWWEGQPGFWRYVWDRKNFVLEPNKGYLLELELGNFNEESGFWNNDNERLELFFPSSGNLGSITNTTVNCSIPEHACTIDRHATEGLPDTGDPRTSYNRTIFDSHWNVMPVPTYVNATPNAWNNTTWTAKIGPKFLYTWNMDDNTLTATSGAGYRYHAMHAYMVQYGGNVRWVTSASPAGIVARSTYSEEPTEVEFRLEIQQNEKMIDQTFIALSNDETVSADFQFGEDMSKDFNARNANIFTKIGTTFAAGNTMPMTDQKTIVPVGVVVKKTGEYTFSIPDGTNGIGITLIDEETGIRTSLSALDYTIELAAGDYTERFWLEISPVKGAETGIDPGVDARENGVRKVMIDGILYIIRDGKMYDARGARVE